MTNSEYNEQDIQLAWKKMVEIKFSNDILKKKDIMEAITKTSNSQLSDLRKGLKHKIYFAIGFAILFLILGIKEQTNVEYNMFLYVLSALYTVGAIAMYLKYKKINDTPIAGNNILFDLKRNLSDIRSTLNVEKIWGVITFLLLMAFYTFQLINKHAADSPKLLAVFIVGLIVFFLGLWIGADKMNEMRFGKTIKKLEADIIRLETINQ